jgi:SAM-dependent methyltransferase
MVDRSVTRRWPQMRRPRSSRGCPGAELDAVCPYCLTRSAVALQYADARMTACPSCKAWFTWPRPTVAAIAAHYDRTSAGMPRALREWRAGTNQEKWYELLARNIARRAAGRRVTRVVDVGAGGLELTVSLARAFPDATVEAWDLFADGFAGSLPADVASRIVLKRADLNRLEDGTGPAQTFDVVACVAVIEHVLDPLGLLQLLRSILASKGTAHVVGPEVTSRAHRLMGRRWPYYSPDDHITLPSLRSIERAVALTGGGSFELRRLNVHYSLRYLLRFLRVPVPLPRWADALLPVPAGAFELVVEKA